MLTFYYLEDSEVLSTSDLKECESIDLDSLFWIDVFLVSDEELIFLKENYNVELSKIEVDEAVKIEHSARYRELKDEIRISSNFLYAENGAHTNKPVTFILKKKILITQHKVREVSFDELFDDVYDYKKLDINGSLVFIKIFEKIIDFDIDLIEDVTIEIAELTKKISLNEKFNEAHIYEITKLQEEIMNIRRNIVDKERIISSISKNATFDNEFYQRRLEIIEKDIKSIMDYISFDFERLEYLQDNLMGLLNIKQNDIMKLFTLVSVIFLPPTLIASIYGMNFADMPELKYPHSYPIALGTMFVLTISFIIYFKKKKWF